MTVEDILNNDENQTSKSIQTDENQTRKGKDDLISEKIPQITSPQRKLGGDIGVSNITQLNALPHYKIKIIFNYIDICDDHEPYIPSGDGEWDLIAYVQGKKLDLTAASGTKEHPQNLWDISDGYNCNSRVWFKPGTEVSVDIPADPSGNLRDSQPLSIFTVGSEVDGCLKSNLPSQLDEVQKVISEKGTVRPYYADAKEKISKIQYNINAGLNDACLGNVHNKNDILGVINELYFPPGYGKYVSSYAGNPETAGPFYHASSTGDFHIWYSINCPLCAGIRQH